MESEDTEVFKFTEGWRAEFEVLTLVFQNIVDVALRQVISSV